MIWLILTRDQNDNPYPMDGEASLPRFAHYYNEYAQLIGHDAADVNAWLAAHPGYGGSIWYNHADSGDDVDVTSIFAAPDHTVSIPVSVKRHWRAFA